MVSVFICAAFKHFNCGTLCRHQQHLPYKSKWIHFYCDLDVFKLNLRLREWHQRSRRSDAQRAEEGAGSPTEVPCLSARQERLCLSDSLASLILASCCFWISGVRRCITSPPRQTQTKSVTYLSWSLLLWQREIQHIVWKLYSLAGGYLAWLLIE